MNSILRHISSLTLLGCLSWIGGNIIGTLWGNAGIWIVILLCCVIVFWKVRTLWIITLCMVCLFIGYSWSLWSLSTLENQKNTLGESIGWNGFNHTIIGEAVSLLGVNEYNGRYKVTVSHIDGKKYDASIALVVPPNITLSPGDTLTAFGAFRFPEDTPEYAGEKTLWYRGMIAEFQSFQSSKAPPETYSRVVRIQRGLDERLRKLFPPSGYLILSGILLGQRTAMDIELREHLKASGLMHIMVVSGGNIMMLIIFLSLFIRSLPIFIRIGIIALTIFGFTIIVGGDMPVWRAALMGTIGYTASLWGYRFPSLILPLAVAVIISLWSPLSLVYDIGLQLSFLSVICIIVWGKKLTHALRTLGPFFSEATALTLAATVGTFPITVFYFGTFSLIGPIANMLAAPVIPLLMYSGIFTLMASIFSPTLAVWMGYIPWIGTTYLSHIITFFGSQKWSLMTIDILAYRGLFLTLTLGILCLAIIKTQRTRKT